MVAAIQIKDDQTNVVRIMVNDQWPALFLRALLPRGGTSAVIALTRRKRTSSLHLRQAGKDSPFLIITVCGSRCAR